VPAHEVALDGGAESPVTPQHHGLDAFVGSKAAASSHSRISMTAFGAQQQVQGSWRPGAGRRRPCVRALRSPHALSRLRAADGCAAGRPVVPFLFHSPTCRHLGAQATRRAWQQFGLNTSSQPSQPERSPKRCTARVAGTAATRASSPRSRNRPRAHSGPAVRYIRQWKSMRSSPARRHRPPAPQLHHGVKLHVQRVVGGRLVSNRLSPVVVANVTCAENRVLSSCPK